MNALHCILYRTFEIIKKYEMEQVLSTKPSDEWKYIIYLHICVPIDCMYWSHSISWPTPEISLNQMENIFSPTKQTWTIYFFICFPSFTIIRKSWATVIYTSKRLHLQYWSESPIKLHFHSTKALASSCQ